MMTVDSVPLIRALFIVVAFVMAGLVHSAWLGSRWSRALMMPLDGGARIRGRRVFGDNKTLRGFAVMVPAAAFSFWLLWILISTTFADGRHRALVVVAEWLRGARSLGGARVHARGAAEFLRETAARHRAGHGAAHAGSRPSSRSSVDRLDSIVGMLLAVSLVAPTPWLTWVYVVVVGPAIHLSFSVLLYRLGVKERAA